MVREMPLSIFVDRLEVATVLCTPVKLEALVLGFLRFRSFLDRLADVETLDVFADEGIAEVTLSDRSRASAAAAGGAVSPWTRDFGPPVRTRDLSLGPARISSLMDALYGQMVLYPESRGIHSAALSDGEGLLIVAEDVGRHNAVDKVQGEALLRGLPTDGHVLLSTGRISSEMLWKGAHMQTPIIISRTSPTQAAVEGAERLGITLLGYVRPESFILYTHPERVVSADRPLSPVAI